MPEAGRDGPQSTPEQLRRYRSMALAAGIGWRIAAGVIIGAYADRALGTDAIFTLLFTLGAFVIGVRRLLAASAEPPGDAPPGGDPGR